MSWKKIVLMLLLLSAIVGIPYQIYMSGRLQEWEDEAVQQLEQRFGAELEYEDVSFLPLNRLTISGLEFSSEEFSARVPELELYYDFDRFLSRLYRERLDIDLIPALIDSLEVIKAEGAAFYLHFSDEDNLHLTEPPEEFLFHPDLIWDHLSSLPRGAELLLADSTLTYRDAFGQVSIDNLRLEGYSPGRSRLEMALAGDIELAGLEYGDYSFQNKLTASDLTVKGIIDEQSWQMDMNLNLVSADELLMPFLHDLDYSAAGFDLANLEVETDHLQSLAASIQGHGSEIDDMQIDGSGGFERLALPGLDIEDLNWEVSYDDNEGILFLPGLDFQLNGDPVRADGHLSLRAPGEDFALELEGDSLDLGSFVDFLPEDLRAELDDNDIGFEPGQAGLNIRAAAGESGPEASLQIDLEGLSVRGEEMTGEISAAWQEGRLIVDEGRLNFLESGGKAKGHESLSFSGRLDTAEMLYNFSLQTEDFGLDLLHSILPDGMIAEGGEFWPETGALDLSARISGSGLSAEDMQAHIETDLSDLSFADLPGGSAHGEFWYSQGFLEISFLELDTDLGRGRLSGELDLNEESFDIWFDTDRLELPTLAGYVDAEESDRIAGEAEVSGRISGDFAEPELSSTVHVPGADIYGMEIEEGRGELRYSPSRQEFVLDDLVFASRSARVISQGSLDISPGTPKLDLELSVEGLTYEYINELFQIALPLSGDVGGTVDIEGPLDDIRVRSDARSESTVFSPDFVDDYELAFKNSRASFFWSQDEPFQVEDLYMERDNAVFTMNGDFAEDDFSVDFVLENYMLEHLADTLPDFDEDVAGRASIRGEAFGLYEDPGASVSFLLQDMVWQNYELGQLEGEGSYESEALEMSSGLWQPGSGSVRIDGRAEELMADPSLDFNLDLSDLELEYYLNKFGYELAMELPYSLDGNVDVGGSLEDPLADVDITMAGDGFGWGEVNLSGRISDSYDLSLFGSGLELEHLSDIFSTGEVELAGGVELRGDLSGELATPRAELETKIVDLIINDYSLREVTGRAILDEDLNLELEQELLAEDEGRLGLEASLSLQENMSEEASFALVAEDFPLAFSESFVPDNMGVFGQLDGRVEGRGSLEDPELEGRLDLDISELDLDQEDIAEGKLAFDFSGGEMELVDSRLTMGDGYLEAAGHIDILDADDFWHIALEAGDLPLSYQESTADISGELDITGGLYTPQITGDIRFDNMVAVLPEGEMEMPGEIEGEDARFQPGLDINIRAGSNNYARHENAEVKVEEGNLRLLYRDRLTIDGQLSSRQGWAFFYNNRFTLESARLNFAASRGVVPRVLVRASTRTQGTTINVTLDGTPDNINTTFSSVPELTEQEILTLLTSRGALSGFLGGGDRSLGGMIQSEIFRFFSDSFQLQVLEFQRTLREALELDRLEIITHDLGWEQEVSLHMGKDLTDRLYLETQSDFSAGSMETDLIFSYSLTDYTSLGGTLIDVGVDGWQDYSITIETGIEF